MKKPPPSVTDLPLHVRAELALKEAVTKVVERHRRLGLPLVVWKDGKVILLPPDQAQPAAMHEPRAKYSTHNREGGQGGQLPEHSGSQTLTLP